MVDVILRAPLRSFRDRRLRLPLRSNEQQAAAIGDGLRNRSQRDIEHRHRLRQIKNMYAVFLAVDVGFHQRIPPMRLVSEVDSGLQKLAKRERRMSHGHSFPV